MTTREPVHVYRGWPIYTLPAYDTPYYYAQSRQMRGRLVLGPAKHHRTINAVERQIDRELAKGGAR
jgi:hypothetical protein